MQLKSIAVIPQINKGSHKSCYCSNDKNDWICKHCSIKCCKCSFYRINDSGNLRNDCHDRADCRYYLSDHDKNGAEGCCQKCNRNDCLFRSLAQSIKPVNKLLYPSDYLFNGRHQEFSK